MTPAEQIADLEAQLKAWREVAEQLVQLAMDGTHLLDDERAALAQLHRLKTDL
jgi:ribosomal protein L17